LLTFTGRSPDKTVGNIVGTAMAVATTPVIAITMAW
jgi:hypothetical protein